MRFAPIKSSRTIGDTHAAIALFAPDLAGLTHEELRFAYLDSDFRLLMVRSVCGAKDGACALPLRRVIRDALTLNAWGLIMAHNHPRGHSVPSRADQAATRRLTALTQPLDIRLIDHLIFAGDDVTSFHALGLL
jgi:DNA repair protein RadC